ncbi:hypothetical protein [Sphingobacterium paludis]|jgi:hypothetical protein|uniref:Uncharacterized protein n=1 Tax=Sphingobacterium paludis TaxID=1476465 RepID=A0A4R7D9Z3_9SPHI|nr:hypothetical protein [Sphingobacterium paludis]TDS15886.1 hypothetical protein B0I21_102203 [Sphingobacterium paludis]
MKVFVAYIMMVLYAVTCTGATVYMHRCQEGDLIVLKTKKESMPDACPHCMESEGCAENSNDTQTDCHEKENCCSEIVLDLRKGETKMENASNMLPLFTTSPAILTLFWILPIPDSNDHVFQAPVFQSSPTSVTDSPPYLIHCNFRI